MNTYLIYTTLALSLIYLTVLYFTLRWAIQFKKDQKPTVTSLSIKNWVEKLEAKKTAIQKMNQIS
jgi:hypothetical protein